MKRQSVLLLLPLLGCDSLVTVSEADSGSTGAVVGTSSGGPGDDPVATTIPDPGPGTTPDSTSGPTTDPTTDPIDTTTGPVATTSGGESTTDPGPCQGGFICEPDVTSSIECSTWEQDCPEGEKCMPWANDGGSAWNATRCSPIDPNPDDVDEACTVEGSGVSGIDSCVLGAMCWDVDPETDMGTCVPMCIGSENNPMCEDPGRQCTISAEGVLTLCIPQCNPLEPGTCPELQACYPINDGFTCAPDASGDGGGVFEPCEFINACDSGTMCANSEVVGVCDEAFAGCCTPYCDTEAPVCPGMTDCFPFYEEGLAPPGYETLGVCLGNPP